jgi:hypothetical protein
VTHVDGWAYMQRTSHRGEHMRGPRD